MRLTFLLELLYELKLKALREASPMCVRLLR